MTSSSHKSPIRRSAGRPRTGFTLVELMVVIGIIVVLMAILVPSVTRAVRQAQRIRMLDDLQAIDSALRAYQKDHHDYPPVPPGSGLGANILARALIAPAPAVGPDPDFDGQDGPGFRTRAPIAGVPQGKSWGPYLPPDRFRTLQVQIPPVTGPLHWVIVDMKDIPILYFPAHRGADMYANGGYVAAGNPQAMFDFNDNAGMYADGTTDPNSLTLEDFRALMGCDANGKAAAPIADRGTPFVLLSAGPDTNFGARNHSTGRAPLGPKNPSDDVLNIVK